MEQKNAMNTPPRPAAKATKAEATSSSGGASLFSVFAIIIAFIVAVLVFKFVLGDPSRFQGGDPHNNPNPGDYLAIVYKGGFHRTDSDDHAALRNHLLD